MSLFAFDACVNFCLLSPSTGFFLFFVAQKGVRISGIPSTKNNHKSLFFSYSYLLFWGESVAYMYVHRRTMIHFSLSTFIIKVLYFFHKSASTFMIKVFFFTFMIKVLHFYHKSRKRGF